MKCECEKPKIKMTVYSITREGTKFKFVCIVCGHEEIVLARE